MYQFCNKITNEQYNVLKKLVCIDNTFRLLHKYKHLPEAQSPSL